MRSGNTTCDYCGAQLFGRFGTKWIQKDHISFKGTFTQQLPEQSDFVYVSNNPTDEHHFCDLVCLEDFIKFKVDRHVKRRHDENLEKMRADAIKG